MFNAKGGDGVAADLPYNLRPRPPINDEMKSAKKRAFYHDTIRFKLPDGSPVQVSVVITTRRKWETKKLDKSGWAVIPFSEKLGRRPADDRVTSAAHSA